MDRSARPAGSRVEPRSPRDPGSVLERARGPLLPRQERRAFYTAVSVIPQPRARGVGIAVWRHTAVWSLGAGRPHSGRTKPAGRRWDSPRCWCRRTQRTRSGSRGRSRQARPAPTSRRRRRGSSGGTGRAAMLEVPQAGRRPSRRRRARAAPAYARFRSSYEGAPPSRVPRTRRHDHAPHPRLPGASRRRPTYRSPPANAFITCSPRAARFGEPTGPSPLLPALSVSVNAVPSTTT